MVDGNSKSATGPPASRLLGAHQVYERSTEYGAHTNGVHSRQAKAPRQGRARKVSTKAAETWKKEHSSFGQALPL